MERLRFAVVLVVCLIVAIVGGFYGGQASVAPQTVTTTMTEAKTELAILTETHILTLPPTTKTLTETKTLTSYRTITTTSYMPVTKILTATVTVTPSSFPTITATVTKTVTTAPAGGCEIYVLKDRDYYFSLISDLKNAKKKILVAMYSMVYDADDPFDWANDLIRELVNAKERGVDVRVIIEYRTYWGYMDENLDAYNYLQAHGVNVRLDDEKDTDHMKLVIIDSKIVYIGSHNWSESALHHNHETSVKIVSEETAKTYEAYFETI